MKDLATILRLLIVFVVASRNCASAEPQTAVNQNRYNVLFIAVDDLRPELGCYGVETAQSPYLDRFSETAVTFDRHYVQVPTCGASRYALLTGRSPAQTGVTSSNAAAYSGKFAFKREKTPGAQTLPELFHRSGYYTSCLGKISHTPDGRVFAYNGTGDGRDELPFAWDELSTPFGPWQRGWGIFFAYANGRHRESGQGDLDLMEFIAENDEDLPDGMIAATACEQLTRFSQQKQPFFLGIGFFKPHLPFVAPHQDWEATANVEREILTQLDAETDPQKWTKPDSPYWHASGEFYKYKTPFEKTQPLSREAIAKSRRAYAACVRYADRQIGRVLDTLDQAGLAEKTIVVIWGDHGWHLGEQQIWGKHSPFERANRSVLMIRMPGAKGNGSHTSSLAETIDLYPTLLEACQPEWTNTEHSLDGVSLLPVLESPQTSVRDVAISYWNSIKSVRTPTHRLFIEIPKKGGNEPRIACYDLSSNPDNVSDIAAQNPELVDQILQQAGLKE